MWPCLRARAALELGSLPELKPTPYMDFCHSLPLLFGCTGQALYLAVHDRHSSASSFLSLKHVVTNLRRLGLRGEVCLWVGLGAVSVNAVSRGGAGALVLLLICWGAAL